MNHCIIPVNKIHEELYDKLEEQELSMERLCDEYEITKIIKQIVANSIITTSINYATNDENYVAMTHAIANSIADKTKELFFDTAYLEMNDDYTYEVVFNDSRGTDENLNHFATITNNEQMPLYDTCCVVKCNNKKETAQITKNDIANIYINMFFHKGLLIKNDGEEIELPFVGDTVEPYLKSGFVQIDSIFICGLNLIIYGDGEKEGEINVKASTLFKKTFTCNIFIAMLCPVSGKYFSNFTKQTFKKLMSIVENNYLKHVEDNVMEIAGNNPFLIIEKYC